MTKLDFYLITIAGQATVLAVFGLVKLLAWAYAALQEIRDVLLIRRLEAAGKVRSITKG